jgi:hypothetical protein
MTTAVHKPVAHQRAFSLNELKFDQTSHKSDFSWRRPGRQREAGTSFSMAHATGKAFWQAVFLGSVPECRHCRLPALLALPRTWPHFRVTTESKLVRSSCLTAPP